MSITSEVKYILTPLGLNVESGRFPESDNSVMIKLVSDPERSPQVFFGQPRQEIEYQGIQLIFRNVSFEQNLTALEAARRTVLKSNNVVQKGAIEDLGNDENGRSLLAFTFYATTIQNIN